MTRVVTNIPAKLTVPSSRHPSTVLPIRASSKMESGDVTAQMPLLDSVIV